MTQQPYYPQYPGQPAVQQPQQGYPQQAPQPPVQLANGGLDEFYSQPNTGGGPGVSWKGKPDGYTVQGVVTRDVGDGDVQQEVGAPNTAQAGQPQVYRDGRPKFVMSVPLQVAQSQEFPEGEARLFVRGQLKDELARAMAEAGEQGAPRAGAVLAVTLVQRKPGRGTIPMNVFAVTYTPPGGQPPQVQQPQPVQQYAQQPQQQAPQQFQQQFQQQAPPPQYAQQPQQAPQQFQQPQYAQGGQASGAPSPAPGAPSQPVQQQQAPAQQGQPQPPAGLSPEQQELLAKLNAQQAG